MRRNVSVFYVYKALRGAHVWILFVVWVVFLRDMRGLNLTEIGLIDASFWVSMALGEIPTGVVADKVGRKASLLVGSLLEVAGILVFVLSASLPLLIIANVVLGVAFTFHSGASDALLYESLMATGKADEYATVAGRAGAISQAIVVVAGLAGSAVATAGLIYPFIIGCALAGLMVLAVLLMREPPQSEVTAAETVASQRPTYGSILRGAVVVLRGKAGAMAIIVYMAVAGAITYLIGLFIQPLAIDAGTSASIVAIAVVAINVGGIGGSLLAGKVGTAGLERQLLLFAPLVVAGLMLFIWWGNSLAWFVLPCIATSFVFSLLGPTLGSMLNKRVHDQVRATVLSFQSVVATAFLAVLSPTIGRVVDTAQPRHAFVFIAALAIGYSVYHLISFRKTLLNEAK